MIALLKAYALVQVAKIMTYVVSAMFGLFDRFASYQKNSVPIDTESEKSVKHVLYGAIKYPNSSEELEITARLNHYLGITRNEMNSFNATGLYEHFGLGNNDIITIIARITTGSIVSMIVPMNKEIPWEINGTQVNTPRFGCIENCI
jgi:hypothetical protein